MQSRFIQPSSEHLPQLSTPACSDADEAPPPCGAGRLCGSRADPWEFVRETIPH